MAKVNRYNTFLELITLARGGLSDILHSVHDVDFGYFGYVIPLCLDLVCCGYGKRNSDLRTRSFWT